MHRWGRRLGSAIVVVGLVSAACSSSGGGSKDKAAKPAPKPSAPSTPSTNTTIAAGWQTAGVQVASQLNGEGDTIATIDASNSPDMQAVVIDAATGNVRFRRPWSPSGRYGGMGLGSPAVLGDVVVTMEAGGPLKSVLVGVDAHTGAERWRQTIPQSFGPFACGALICVEEGPQDAGALVGRDPATGAQVWRSAGLQSSVVTEKGMLVVYHLGKPILASVDQATGKERWRADLTKQLGPSASTTHGWDGRLIAGVLLASVGDDSEHGAPGGVVGLDPATGAVRWTRPKLDMCVSHPPDVALLCGSDSGMSRIDPATGKDMWTSPDYVFPLGLGATFGMTADGSKIAAAVKDRKLGLFDVASGAPASAGPPAWIVVYKTLKARVSEKEPSKDYLDTTELLPWDPAANAAASVTKASEIPPSVGLTLSGYRIFVDGAGVLHGLHQ